MISMRKISTKIRQFSYNLKKNYLTRDNIVIAATIIFIFCFAWSAQQYYLTAEYQELTARAKQGKILDGETMVILPDNSESAKNKYSEESSSTQNNESNFSQWLRFLFG